MDTSQKETFSTMPALTRIFSIIERKIFPQGKKFLKISTDE